MPASVTRQAASKRCWPARILSSGGISRASRNSSRYNSSISRCVSGGAEYRAGCSRSESEFVSLAILSFRDAQAVNAENRLLFRQLCFHIGDQVPESPPVFDVIGEHRTVIG